MLKLWVVQRAHFPPEVLFAPVQEQFCRSNPGRWRDHREFRGLRSFPHRVNGSPTPRLEVYRNKGYNKIQLFHCCNPDVYHEVVHNLLMNTTEKFSKARFKILLLLLIKYRVKPSFSQSQLDINWNIVFSITFVSWNSIFNKCRKTIQLMAWRNTSGRCCNQEINWNENFARSWLLKERRLTKGKRAKPIDRTDNEIWISTDAKRGLRCFEMFYMSVIAINIEVKQNHRISLNKRFRNLINKNYVYINQGW